jgi:hypothetical protein|tara:strand:+ start:1763 stop:2731 length:969 start_codon:yes stop_codon:yes gene_type:complete
MADQNKFEKMLELLVNEDKEAAQELFHEIVVEKSRDIYESLLEDEAEVDEATDEEVDEATDEEVDEATDEDLDESDDETVEEGFDLDEFEVEADPMDMDKTDDMMADLGMDDEGEEGDDEDAPEGDVEDRVEDLEDALDDLKAEFEKMMAGDDDGEDDEGEEEPEEEAFAFEASDEEVEEATDEEVDEATDEEVDEAADEEVDESKEPQTAGEQMREYVEKVSATMGDNGANTKSTVAGANDMGGTAGNLNQAGSDASAEAGAGSTVKGNALSDTSAKDMNTKNVNVPGGKAAKAGKTEPGHGAEKKSKPETADNKTSVVGK